jgi:hypothetical protein
VFLALFGCGVGCSAKLPPPEKTHAPSPRADLGPLVPLGVVADRVKLQDRPVQTDGVADFAFRVRVSGEVLGFVLMSSDPAGNYEGHWCWDTFTAPFAFPKELHIPYEKGERTAVIAAFDEKDTPLNPDVQLVRSRFMDETVTIYASDPRHAAFLPGHTYTLLVLRPGGRVDRATTTLL